MITQVRAQLPSTLKLATPVALGELGFMSMGLVDTYMVGSLGAVAIGSVGLGSAIFFAVSAMGIGLLLSLDFLISYSYGSRRPEECRYWLIQGLWTSLLLAIPSTILLFVISELLPWFGFEPEVAAETKNFLKVISLGFFPFFAFIALRQYLQSMNRVRAANLILILGNIANFGLNALFIYGYRGFPRLGIVGSALSTSMTRLLMMATLAVLVVFSIDPKIKVPLRYDRTGLKRIFVLGGPAAFQLFFEMAVFSLSTMLAGKIGAIDLAAHTIVLNIASFTFMVPMGISAAAAIQVGQCLGARELDRMRAAGWACFLVSFVFMSTSGAVLSIFGTKIMGLFTSDHSVMAVGSRILLIAAFFQIADGTQTVGSGALRGLSDTRTSMFANLVGHWLIGLPVGYALCFYLGFKLPGIWAGLTLGLFIVGGTVLLRWAQYSRSVSL